MLDRLSDERFDPLDREEEKAVADRLVRAIDAGDLAEQKRIRHMLVERNARLVMYVGKAYAKKLPREEIFSVGVLALTRAVERWDPRKGHLYGWATRWITTALTRAVDASRMIRIPQSVAHEAAMVQKDIARREAELGRPLTAAEEHALTAGRARFESHPHVASSLQQTASAADDNDGTVEDLLVDDAIDPGEEAAASDLAHRVKAALRELSPMEQKVIAARFGIDGEEMKTLAELGRENGVSGEAMRRVEVSALAKLRHPAVKLSFTEQQV